jgi:hypothetical protein
MPQTKVRQALATAQAALHHALAEVKECERPLHKAEHLVHREELALWPTLEAVMAVKEATEGGPGARGVEGYLPGPFGAGPGPRPRSIPRRQRLPGEPTKQWPPCKRRPTHECLGEKEPMPSWAPPDAAARTPGRRAPHP